MRKLFANTFLFIFSLTALSGNTAPPRDNEMDAHHGKLQPIEYFHSRSFGLTGKYPEFLQKLDVHENQENSPPLISAVNTPTHLSLEPLQILVNGSDSTSIIQGEDMLITVVFSDGSAEADINLWFDLNADALWDPETDLDIENPFHIVDNDAQDEDPAFGIYQFNISGSAGISMVANMGILVTGEDTGGSDAAYVFIQPIQTDYSVAGQIIPAFSNLFILAVSLDNPYQEPWITVSNIDGEYEVFVPVPGNYLIVLVDFLMVLEGEWMAETNYIEYVDGHLVGYNFQILPVVGEFTGQLTDQDGLPVSGIEIHVIREDASFPFPLSMTNTDPDGNYTIGVYASDWIVSVNSDYLIPFYLVPPPSEVFTILPGDTVVQDFRIYAVDSYISGTVYLDDAVYDQGVTIIGDSELGSAQTTSGVDGTYMLPVSGLADQAGGYSVSIDEYELPEGLSSQDHYEGVFSGSDGIDFHLMTLTGGVSGFIYDAVTFNPVAGTQLHLIETETAQHFSGMTNDSGYFEIALPAGIFNMLIFPQDYYNHLIPDIMVTDAYVQLTVYLEPLILSGSIYGYVTELMSGNPVNGVPVTASTGFDNSWFTADTLTDSTGYYSLEVPSGTFFVQAVLEGWAQLGNSPVAVDNDQVQQDLILAPLSGAIQGMVTDVVTGLPVAGAWVYADNGAQNWGSGADTAEDGSYTVALINGVYVVSAEADGYLTFESSDIEVQDDFISLDIALTPEGSLQLGDVNGDQALNVLDVVLLVGFILGSQEPTPQQAWAADVNGDGAINVLDIVSLVDLILNG
ncbi:MAG: hypothetical protein GXO91_03220 [FCB group bacterium]|nr:hypothetical protein [FCB group bacterium]